MKTTLFTGHSLGAGGSGKVAGIGAGAQVGRRRIKLSLAVLVGGSIYIDLPILVKKQQKRPTGQK